MDRAGRVRVLPDLSIPGHPEVFVVGDLMVMERDGKPYAPGLAPVAIQQGIYAGRRIARAVAGQPDDGAPFVYRDKGNLATVGRAFAIAQLGGYTFSGFFAWLLWGGVHLLYLTNLWNRFQVFVTWLWAYVTNARTVRVLTSDKPLADNQPSPDALPIHTNEPSPPVSRISVP
jgi:NADH dehydrogenase